MKKFILTYSLTREDNGNINVCIYPLDEEISQYVASYKTYSSRTEATNQVNLFIQDQTPILFSMFKDLDFIDISIRDQYEL